MHPTGWPRQKSYGMAARGDLEYAVALGPRFVEVASTVRHQGIGRIELDRDVNNLLGVRLPAASSEMPTPPPLRLSQ